MYCTNCGKEVGETAKFCPACGKPTKMVLQEAQAQADSAVRQEELPEEDTYIPARVPTIEWRGAHKKWLKVWMILFGIFGFLMWLVAIMEAEGTARVALSILTLALIIEAGFLVLYFAKKKLGYWIITVGSILMMAVFSVNYEEYILIYFLICSGIVVGTTLFVRSYWFWLK